jgi:uncharacterized cysteine cluster protein YcgN (CxxCxxCC family)
MSDDAFWKTKTLDELTKTEWEALCDGCGQCCQLKLEDVDTGRVGCTSVVCHLLDIDACRCLHYDERHIRVPDCIEFDAAAVAGLYWLPETCAYRLRAEGRPLLWWHHLVSGDRETVHRAGISVRGRVMSEAYVHPSDIENRVVHWIEPKDKTR